MMADKDKSQALAEFGRLADIMERLRGPDGCEWDRAQDFASIAPYTLEEAHEVADAIARQDMADLCEELGDLLLQVVFHAQMAAEAGHFTLADVGRGICDKMERRHPHIFRSSIPLCAEEVKANWESIKAAEKPRDSVLDGIALTLPALTRAEKLANRAARTGFDWPDPSGPLAKIHEELEEVAQAETPADLEEEAGDLLFAAANYVRKLGVDPEAVLRAANRKFEQRFRKIEKEPDFSKLSLSEQEALWQSSKRL
ncbi:nucleoside triphosphate pyrophosphohydrolase [Sandaracinobacter sp. RS1-74]|uniref:nucleoside triphosphate pyrophosphohydrolase n=1 Tax=Sandaracinobacteroides sayramensis TaxID=2913411 RepID=UPI001EDA035F|nr:nucleoside triphosphate pyrophosphohydrolase [Sandaracinobacteroides sayramensis]MCG2840052.1 nucleoside triphosphate pyrophosphohydrolase [Sandaracinobacteroides sayramensis]